MKKTLLIVLVFLSSISLSGCRRNKDEKEENLNSNIHLNDISETMRNDVSSYSIKTSPRNSMLGEDVYVYDKEWNLVLSLDDQNQSQYLFALYWNFIILDAGTRASQREMIVYNIPTGERIYETDYYPWDNWLVLDEDNINFYKKIDESLYGNYTLPNCDNGYDNGYAESYGYVIWGNQANNLWDIQCAYFE